MFFIVGPEYVVGHCTALNYRAIISQFIAR